MLYVNIFFFHTDLKHSRKRVGILNCTAKICTCITYIIYIVVRATDTVQETLSRYLNNISSNLGEERTKKMLPKIYRVNIIRLIFRVIINHIHEMVPILKMNV